MNYCPIHVHTEYSGLDSTSTPLEIAQRCQELDIEACGCTDHGTVAGHLEFVQAMQDHDIQPLPGIEAYHGVVEGKPDAADQAHLVLGALNNRGLRNLWRLSSAAATNFYKVPRVNWQMLEEHSEGLFATSACMLGLVSRGIEGDNLDALNRYLEIFGENFFIEIHTYPTERQRALNEQLVHQAHYRGLPLIYANDAHYVYREQWPIHDAYVAMQTGDNILMDPSKRKMWHPEALYIQSETEIRENLGYLPDQVVDEALQNSYDLAKRSSAELPEPGKHLPVFVPSKSPWVQEHLCEAPSSATEAFIDLVEKGLQSRYESLSQDVRERARYEVKTLLDAGLESYFLIVWDICRFADSKGIKRGPGRGSSAGCLVAYALGITDIDPIHYGLFFERFYNPGREDSLPDIDLDFPQEARSQIRDYLSWRWGEKQVRTIGNVRRMAPRETINRTYSVCGITWDEKEHLKAIIEEVPDMDILTLDHVGWSRESDPGKTVYVMDHVGDKISEWIESCPPERQPLLWRWLELVDTVCTRVSGYGVHASGIVVSDVDLDDELPAMWSAQQQVLTTQFAMGDVEARGFPKIDILGLRNLDTLEEWERLTGKSIDWNDLPDLEQGWEIMDRGQTLGIFQMEGNYAKQLSKQFRPRNIDDLSALVALNRPGPIRAGAPDALIARRMGNEEVSYEHEMLEPILRETYGEWLYQEEVLHFFNALGYDLGDSDAVRKILGKKKPTAMHELYEGTGEWEGKGYKQIATNKLGAVADPIWQSIEGFATYAFNKAHSLSYATLAYGTLLAKAQPREYLLASMKTDPGRVGEYVAEARKMGIKVMPPDILKSDADVSVVDGVIYFGLTHIKGIGQPAAETIKRMRSKWDIGSVDQLRTALESETESWKRKRKANRDRLSPKTQLKSSSIDRLEEVGAFDNYTPRNVALYKKQKAEREYLGVILTDNTEEAFANNQDLVSQCDTYDSIHEDNFDQTYWLPGVVAKVTPKTTRKDKKKMGIISIEYGGDDLEFAVFPNQWGSYQWLFQERTPGIFNLKRTQRGIQFEKGVKLQ